jgi:hypothetical protein
VNFFVQTVGVGLILLALLDIYLTVLHPRIESSLLSAKIARATWYIFRGVAQIFPKQRNQLLTYSGSAIILTIVVMWVLLLVLGFALIVWSGLGTAIQASEGQTPTDFATALYYSGYSLTTLGTGDLVPKTGTYRLLMFLQAALGFSIFTLTITYILSVYSALIRRNTFALSLHHRTNDTASSAELLARLAAGDNLNNIQQDISNIARELMNLLESQNTYSVLLYFRFRQSYYALPRIMYLAMDLATLIQSALNSNKYRSIVESAATAELWCGGLHLLEQVCHALLPNACSDERDYNERLWREHYCTAIKRLQQEGIETNPDLEAGIELYLSLRYEWQPYLCKLIHYMEYDRYEILFSELQRTKLR